MDFNSSGDTGFGITVKGKLLLDLQWAEPWFGVGTDFDAYLVNPSNEVVASSEENNREETQEPFEFLSWENPEATSQTVELVIKRFSGSASPPVKFVMLENGQKDVTSIEYPESTETTTVGPTIVGHSGAVAAVSVSAVRFDDDSKPEYHSSRGPLTHYFKPASSTSPAPTLPTPEDIAKPDLVATDCGATTFFAFIEADVWRFCGTSSAASHAAAVAALMKQANPSLSYSQLRDALATTASPVGSFGPDAIGAGLVNAYDAVSSVALPPAVAITERPPALGKERQPSIGFTASRPVAFSCSLDGGGLQSCRSLFVPLPPSPMASMASRCREWMPPAAPGQAKRLASRSTASAHAPSSASIPLKTLHTHYRRARAVFRFGSNEPGATLVCKVDAGFLRFCKPRLLRRFRLGKHVVWVKARDAAGNVDRTPAVFRLQVKKSSLSRLSLGAEQATIAVSAGPPTAVVQVKAGGSRSRHPKAKEQMS